MIRSVAREFVDKEVVPRANHWDRTETMDRGIVTKLGEVGFLATVTRGMEGEELTDLLQARGVIARIIEWYNTERLHSALGYLRPMDYYRGDPSALHEARRRKMAEARHRRREKNLKLRQPTLPLESTESIANERLEMSHCG